MATRLPIQTIQADFSQSRNDMHWKVFDADDKFVRWTGYDDDFWWSNIAKDPSRFTRVGSVTGKTYYLDPHSGEVTVYSSVDAPTPASQES